MKKYIGQAIRGYKGIVHDQTYRYPAIGKDLERILITRSAQGRPIYAYKIGNGKLPVLLCSGMHGNEVGTVKLAHGIINWLSIEKEPFDITSYIIPCLNPDGFAQARRKPGYFSGGKIGRFNANGVDLNRNFNTSNFSSSSHWNHGKNYASTRKVFAGTKPFSEPETKGVADFVKSRDIKVWFMFHNAGSDVTPNKNKVAEKIAKKFSERSGFTLFSEKDWQKLGQTGTPKQWCEVNKIAFIEVEGSSRWASDWPLLKPALEAALEAF